MRQKDIFKNTKNEILHVECIVDAIRIAKDNLDSKNFYACNPSFDKGCGKMKN